MASFRARATRSFDFVAAARVRGDIIALVLALELGSATSSSNSLLYLSILARQRNTRQAMCSRLCVFATANVTAIRLNCSLVSTPSMTLHTLLSRTLSTLLSRCHVSVLSMIMYTLLYAHCPNIVYIPVYTAV